MYLYAVCCILLSRVNTLNTMRQIFFYFYNVCIYVYDDINACAPLFLCYRVRTDHIIWLHALDLDVSID